MTFFSGLPWNKKHQDLARVKVLIQSGFAALQAEQPKPAREAFSVALQYRDRLKGTHILGWLLTALRLAYLMDEKFEEAIVFFSNYLLRYPGDLEAYSARGTALWYAENWIPAVNDYSRVLEVNPEDIDAIANRGQVLAEMGNFPAALIDLNRALELIQSLTNPANQNGQAINQEAFARRGRADALAGLGDTAFALVELEKSLQICPENAWAWYSRAQVYEKMGDFERATADYQTSLLKTGPKLTPARQERARALVRNR